VNIAGSVALVTGGVSGLGAAVSQLLVEQGAHVVAVDVNTAKGRAFAAPFGGKVDFRCADVRDEAAVDAVVADAAAIGPLRICVNCAGIGVAPARTVGHGPTPYPLERFRLAVEVNLIGAFNVTRLAATQMARQAPYDSDGSRGVVINVGSVAARDGQTGQVAYAAAKAGIAGMTLPLARDLAAIGVRVCTILPGIIDTPIYESDQATPEQIARGKAILSADNLHPRRIGAPAEFASLALELIRNDFMNGETVRIDAGARLRPNPGK